MKLWKGERVPRQSERQGEIERNAVASDNT